MLLTVKCIVPKVYEVYYEGRHITDLLKTDYGDWRFAGIFAISTKEYGRAIYLLLTTVFKQRFKTKEQALIELEGTFARFEGAKAELGI